MIIKYSNQTNISFKFSWLYNSSFQKQSKAPSSGQLVFYFPNMAMFNVQCSCHIARHSTFGFVFHNNLNGSSGNHSGLSVKGISTNNSMKNLEFYPAVLFLIF